MAITPNSYPFSGGAFMGGGGSPVNRDDIHTLNLTKNGESIGNYNPLVGDADVDIPSDAVVISFSAFSGTMPGSAYSKMASAVGAGQVVMLRSVSGASVVYWTLLAASVLSYKFISVSETAVLTVEIQTSGDSSGNHAFTISNVPLTELRVIDTGASSGDDRGHEHTRITDALATGKTVCIKYTSGNNIAYGTLCGAHDGHYTFIVDYGGTPSVLTVISDGSMQISAIFDGDASEFSVTPDGSSTGYSITGPTLLKSFLQKFKNLVSALKALAFKDKASYNDLSSGVQSSLNKADSALQSHQSVTDNNPTLAWSSTSTIGKVGSTDLRVTMPANPASYKVPFIDIDSSLTSLDLNTLTTQGFYYCSGFVSGSVVLSNTPSELNNFTKSWRLEVINQRSRIEQILVNASDNGEDATRVMCIWKRHCFSGGSNWTPWCMTPLASEGGVGSPATPVYVDPNGQMLPCTQGATLKSNNATIYLHHSDTFGNHYHIKDVKNGCVNHVKLENLTSSSGCAVVIEPPTLQAGEEYDFSVDFNTYNNSNVAGPLEVEGLKCAGHYDTQQGAFVGEYVAVPGSYPAFTPVVFVQGTIYWGRYVIWP